MGVQVSPCPHQLTFYFDILLFFSRERCYFLFFTDKKRQKCKSLTYSETICLTIRFMARDTSTTQKAGLKITPRWIRNTIRKVLFQSSSYPTLFSRPNVASSYKMSHPSELKEWVRIGHKYRFFWHPDIVREEFELCGTVASQPSSSTRTLLTEEPFRTYIKTDLDKKHFRFIRRLKRSSVEHSVAICSELRSMCKEITMLARYSFLPESLGLIVVGGKHEGSGTLYREAKPFPHVEEKRIMMPYHSLYALDPNAPGDLPLRKHRERTSGKRSDSCRYRNSAGVSLITNTSLLIASKEVLLLYMKTHEMPGLFLVI